MHPTPGTFPLMAVKIEMPNGARATLQDGEWTSSTLGLANLLEAMMDDCHPGTVDGDPEVYRAQHVAQRVSARILESTPSYEYVPGRVY